MKKAMIVLLVLWLVYATVGLLAPAAQTSSRYGLSVSQTNLLRFTIMLPLLFIWLTAVFNVVRFRHYSRLVKSAPEGEAFRKITMGLWMLLIVTIVPTLINTIASYWPTSATVMEMSTIARNYLTVVLYLVSFWYFWQGSRDLYHTVSEGLPNDSLRIGLVVGVIALVSLLVWAVFNNSFRTTSNDPLVRPTYYLHDGLIILTIIVPYALTWLFGSLTITNLLSYTRKVRGIIYRQIFASVAYGLAVLITLLVVLQFLTQANAALGRAALSVILVIIYLLFLAIAVGHILVARGAKKLTTIEEVQ